MIKKLLIMMLLLIISMKGVNAVCIPPEEEFTSGNNKIITCDPETTTKTTKFVYPEAGNPEPVTFSNNYCEVRCKEEIAFAFPSVRRTYAGMPFSYNLVLSGARSCRAIYPDYVGFDEKYRLMVDMYMVMLGKITTGVPRTDINEDGHLNDGDYNFLRNQAATFVDIEGKKVLDLDNNGVMDSNNIVLGSLSSAIRNMKQEKDDCDGWGTPSNPSSTYEVKPTVNLTIGTSTGDVVETYEYEEITPYNSIMTHDTTTYSSCSLRDPIGVGGNREYYCVGENTYIGWTEIARVNGWFAMKEKKMVVYHGNVMAINDFVSPDLETCWAGRSYYVPLNEVTKPIPGDSSDNGYPLTLSVVGLGNNISPGPKNMSLTVNCNYQVRNLIGPQTFDYYYLRYSGRIATGAKNSLSMYLYRPIDLKDPFPNNREPGANWAGEIEEIINGKKVERSLKEKYITSTADTIQDKSPYKITLNRSNIDSIKRDNADNGYNLFENVEIGPNEFIQRYYEVISTNDREYNQEYNQEYKKKESKGERGKK